MEALQALNPAAMNTGMPPTEEALVRAAKAGVQGAFDVLVTSNDRRVFRHCRRRGLDEQEAADVTQEVFIKAFRWLDRYEHRNAFSTWLYRIAENTCIDHQRKRMRDQPFTQPVPLMEDGLEVEFSGHGMDPQEALEFAQTQALIVETLQEVSPIIREAFVLKEEEGLSYEQIAERQGCSLGAVKSRIYRVRQDLMERLQHTR